VVLLYPLRSDRSPFSCISLATRLWPQEVLPFFSAAVMRRTPYSRRDFMNSSSIFSSSFSFSMLRRLLGDQSKKTLDEMSTKPDVCTNGVRTRIQVFQDMASFLCPGHSWIKVDDTNRICEVCGGKEDGESLDNWLQETYTRGCHNCDNCNVDSDLLNDIQSGEKMSRLSEYAVCRAEEFSSPDEEAETKLLAFMQGEDNCPHWIGRN